jgi:hypothetical protein
MHTTLSYLIIHREICFHILKHSFLLCLFFLLSNERNINIPTRWILWLLNSLSVFLNLHSSFEDTFWDFETRIPKYSVYVLKNLIKNKLDKSVRWKCVHCTSRSLLLWPSNGVQRNNLIISDLYFRTKSAVKQLEYQCPERLTVYCALRKELLQ